MQLQFEIHSPLLRKEKERGREGAGEKGEALNSQPWQTMTGGMVLLEKNRYEIRDSRYSPTLQSPSKHYARYTTPPTLSSLLGLQSS